MHSDEGKFWDQRYSKEGPIWGTDPSPTAVLAAQYLPAGAHVLDAGFGYGRDLAFLLKSGFRVSGIDLSVEGRRLALDWLHDQGLKPEQLWTGRFEETAFPEPFDAILSHRVIHLMETAESVAAFAGKVESTLRPGGLLCVAARNPHDLHPDVMVRVADRVYEYAKRPGHRIRYWDDQAFQEAFGDAFAFLALTEKVEQESAQQPVPCHCTVMIGRKKESANGQPGRSAGAAKP
jgi:SAM-dependent methyltransferase